MLSATRSYLFGLVDALLTASTKTHGLVHAYQTTALCLTSKSRKNGMENSVAQVSKK